MTQPVADRTADIDAATPEQDRPVGGFPFTAVVGAEQMALALILSAVSPQIGGVLVRGEKGTAKSTMVRALTAVMPEQAVVVGCRFGCDPDDVDPACPDGPHQQARRTTRPARLVELPVGATEDRVIGSLDLQRVLGEGRTTFEPGLLADANRGILYVDEVNLLHDHLVDLLLDAAAMGRSTVERDGISISHAARVMLVGTMNPEEGELRPQLLDRFGLTVEVAAPRDPQLRAEVIARRMDYDAAPERFRQRFAADEARLRDRIIGARQRLAAVGLSRSALMMIARVCAGFETDGMRADIVTARAAVAHAAWQGHDQVTREDIRAAALLALPHRRRRNPFDAPGLDEDLLDRLLGDEEPEPDPPTDQPPSHEPDDHDGVDHGSVDHDSVDHDSGDEGSGSTSDADPSGPADRDRPGAAGATDSAATPGADQDGDPGAPADHDRAPDADDEREPSGDDDGATGGPVAAAGTPYRTRLFTARGLGTGAPGRRSRAVTDIGRVVRAADRFRRGDRLHLTGTVRAAARQAGGRRPPAGREPARREAGARLTIGAGDLRGAVTEGREANLVLLVVDASGSMAARRRMEAVKTATLSLLLDAYQRRDRVALITFAGRDADLVLPPTSSVEVAARRMRDLPTGGRTPLAEGLLRAAEVIRIEQLRDPRRRPLLIMITDGRATAGPDAVDRSERAADLIGAAGIDTVLIDCETGRFRLGLAAGLARRLRADYRPIEQVAADDIVGLVRDRKPERGAA